MAHGINVKIEGPDKTDPTHRTSFGTAFVLGRPLPKEPSKGGLVLVTAAHVFESISGDTATLILRRKQADGLFESVSQTVQIRNGATP